MAFYDQTGFGNPVDNSLSNISNLSNAQSQQSLLYGQQAAQYADPFMNERGFYQNQLKNVVSNPGSLTSSPYYQFAYDQGLNALQRKGLVNSGNKLAQLMQYGQGLASQAYGQQVGLLTPLAMGGSSPGAAGLAYAQGVGRSQDQAQIGAAARGAGQSSAANAGTQPWWVTEGNQMIASQDAARNATAAGNYSGYSGYSGLGYDPYSTYTPSSYAGTGYATTGGNSTSFGQYDPFSDPYWSSGGENYMTGAYDPNTDPGWASSDYGDFYG